MQFSFVILTLFYRWWYGPILPDDVSFPSACRQMLTQFLLSVSFHLSRKRPADAFLDFLTNSSSIIIVFINELSAALMVSSFSSIEPSDALQQYLENNPSSNLASVLDVTQQRRKLKAIAEDILDTFLESKAYDCQPVKVFLREILAGVCLEITIQGCSKPEWINAWIVYLLEESEPELMTAIDAGVDGATANDIKNSAAGTLLDEKLAETRSPLNETTAQSRAKSEHKRTVSRAETAMEEAMQEAKRLSELIAAEEAKKLEESDDTVPSGATTAGRPTPTSSMSDLGAHAAGSSTSLDNDYLAKPQPTQELTPELISEPTSSFTSFDQIIGSQAPTALQHGQTGDRSAIPPLTLHNATISIFDDSVPGEKGTLRSKPIADYLLQIEPSISQHPGWMMARKYTDFETLHEVLRRISVIAGVPEFGKKHAALPPWKNNTKAILRDSLERYLRDALTYNQLAESEGMKRFLEKDQGLGQSSPGVKQGGFGFPTPAAFESMGKGMLDVLSAAPKGAAGGGKAILGGVTGVLGGVGSLGQKKQASTGTNRSAQSSHTNLSRIDSLASESRNSIGSRPSFDLPRKSFSSQTERTMAPTLPNRPILSSHSRSDTADTSSLTDSGLDSTKEISKSASSTNPPPPTLQDAQTELHLPPPPSEITDDYLSSTANKQPQPLHSSSTNSNGLPHPSSHPPHTTPIPQPEETAGSKPPLTEQETRVAIELFFAMVSELYTLSSAWSIRRTLLNAAKSFLLRPGNPNLEAIRQLIQSTVIDANTSDKGLARCLNMLRESTVPTPTEEATTTEEIRKEGEARTETDDEEERKKAELREKARKLLVEKGMPPALTSVMGSAASGEAVGRVFDCLQVEQVARGLVFALVVQVIRGVVQ